MKKFSFCAILLVAFSGQAQEVSDSEQEGAWYDDFREGIAFSVDSTARWVDSFFAEDRFNHNYRSYGRLSVAPQWSGYDGFEVKSRFRARVNLPHAEDEFSAFIGRVDDGEFLDEGSAGRPSIIRTPNSDQEWLVGLGFDPHMNEQHRVSYSVGIRGGLNPDPYVRTRYRTDITLTEKSLTRLQSSLFWRDSDGYGVAQRIDFEATLTDKWLARWSSLGTYAQETQGLRWSSTVRGYRLYGEDKAFAVESWVEGETDAEVPVQDYGLRLLNRQRYLREWLFVETWVGYHWPRELLTESRRGHWLVGLEVEIHFGTTNAYMPKDDQSSVKDKSNTNGS